jgi:hypothetical protein
MSNFDIQFLERWFFIEALGSQVTNEMNVDPCGIMYVM